MLGSIFCRIPVPAPTTNIREAPNSKAQQPRGSQEATAARVEELLLFRLSRCLQCRSSVLQERDLLLAAGAEDDEIDEVDGEDNGVTTTALQKGTAEATPRRLQRRPPRPPSSSSTLASVLPATVVGGAGGLYGSARVPDIRLTRDPVAAYRESLRVSMRAFRQRRWRPLDVETLESARDPEGIDRRSCRLGRGGGVGSFAGSSSRPMSAAGSTVKFPAPRRRPKSVPAEALNSRATAAAAAVTAAAVQKESSADEPASPQPLRLEDCAPAFTPRFYDWQGDIESDKDNAAIKSSATADRGQRSESSASNSGSGRGAQSSNGEGDSSDDDQDDSDAEDDNDVDEDARQRQRKLSTSSPRRDSSSGDANATDGSRRRRFRPPELNLPPELEPQFLLASSCLEPDRIEFSAKLVRDLPRFEFQPALPDPFSKASFRTLVDCDNGWRSVFPEGLAESEPSLAGLMDRLVAMERLQLHTVRMEAARFGAAASGGAASAAKRVTSASGPTGGRPRSRNCCRGCLQVGCAGDCPLKRAPSRICLHCRQPMCLDRACLRRTYDDRAREVPDTQQQQQQQQQQQKISSALLPSKFCKPCDISGRQIALRQPRQPGPTAALLSRPRSQLPTYSSSAQSKRLLRSNEPRKRQPASVNFPEQLQEPSAVVADVTREQNRFRPYAASSGGRNALLPGKTRASMRRHSLTAGRRVWSAV